MLTNYGLIFVSLVLVAGMAVDTGLLERSYLQLQAGTQAAATAASICLQRAGSATAITAAGKAVASINGYASGTNGVTVTIENPPTAGTYSGNSLAVRAVISQPVATTFLGIFGTHTMQAQWSVLTPTRVSLTSYFNVNAIYSDAYIVTNPIPGTGGFDANSHAYSATALGAVRAANNLGTLQSWRGNIFFLGPPNVANGVSNTIISLPHGSYSQMLLLAATESGPKTAQSFVVKYSDTTTTNALIDMSDWCNPLFYAGETVVSQEDYREQGSGKEYLPNCIYGYSINLDNTKTLSTLTLPAIRNVVLLALDLK